MVAVLYEAAGNGCDLIFRFHVGLVPDGIGQVCLRAVAEDRAAVGLGAYPSFSSLSRSRRIVSSVT